MHILFRYVKYSEFFLKKIPFKKNPFAAMCRLFLIEEHSKGRWTLKGHCRGTWAIEEHSKGTWALKAIGDSSTWGFRTLGTRVLKALRHLRTPALEGHLGNRDTRGVLFSRSVFINLFQAIVPFYLKACLYYVVNVK